ncbi:IS4 family transposase [Microcoleus sp. OTE_8_concoct_300]|uniref:IS4 family transposase n=1 Tax=Microcoleus sp. OTE_8_concoct_300 TaxID=2964710 RepID=UPI00403F6746
MIAESYHAHLSKKLTHSNYLLTILLIQVVQSIKEVTLESIATKLAMPIKFESRRKKIQRFLSDDEWNLDDIWLSLVIAWIQGNIKQNNVVYLAIDRTKWQSNNILMVSMIWRKRAIPIYWKMLDKQGNSTLENQQFVLTPVFDALSDYKLLVLGDREFCSVTLGNWLREKKVDFCLRLKKNVCIKIESELWAELKMLGLEPGNSFFNQEVTIRKTAPITGFNLAGKWLGKYRNITTKEPWYILTSLADIQAAVDAYAKRFGIEEMFRDFKGGGYNLERTNLTGERLSKLLILLSLAYLKSIIQGIEIKSKQVQEYLSRKTENYRKYARHSTFYIGLWGESWVDSMFSNWQVVVELMSLSPHKLPNYQQGIRAMRLILSAL